MILTETGVLKLMQRIKSFIASQLNTKANSVHTHSISEIDDLSSLSMGGGVYSKSEVDTLLTGKADTSHTHTKSQITDFPTIPSKTSDLTNDLGFISSEIDSSGTGWVRFKSGLQICWMQGGLSDSVYNWIFPKTFLQNPSVTATIYYGGSNINAYQRSIELNNLSSTGVLFRSANHMFGSNSYSVGTDSVSAIAIGRWK